MCAIQEINGHYVHRNQGMDKRRRENRRVRDLSDTDYKALSGNGTDVLSHCEPGDCETKQQLHEVKAGNLLYVFCVPEMVRLHK